jgi:hypothetical protein
MPAPGMEWEEQLLAALEKCRVELQACATDPARGLQPGEDAATALAWSQLQNGCRPEAALL